MSVEERRSQILRSLGEVLRDRRIDTLTMQDIADRLGMTKGNLYYYFKSKREILFKFHLKSTADSLRLLEDAAALDTTPTERLRVLIQGLVRSVVADPYGAVVTTNLATLSVSQRRRYLALRDRFEHGVRRLIEQGIDCGAFVDCDVKVSGLAILGAINSIPRWYDVEGGRSADEIAATFSGLLVRGLRR